MERLIQTDDFGNWSLKGVSWKDLYSGKEITTNTEEKVYAALCKLKDYEESGLTPEARRRKADFRKTLNMLLTAEIDNGEYKPVLESLGVECTLESAILMAQIKEAMAGDTKAATFIAKYSGQSPESEENRQNRDADTELKRARKQAVTGENETDEALDKLDSILKELHENAVKQETE